MSAERSSIQRGARRGRISGTAIAAIVAIVVVAAGAAAYIAFVPRSGPEIVRIDGSSTVYPITSAWAGEFNNPGRQVVVAFSGTGGGFAKFCAGETALSDASRPIKQSERDACAASGISGIIEFKVGYDGLSVIVNKNNDWVDHLTVGQLCRIWTQNLSAGACGGEGPQVNLWSELNGSWPARKINLLGPGTASGTFDYFIEVILTPTGDRIRSDFIGSENDNVIITGVANDQDGLAYLGYAYVVENLDTIRAVAIDGGAGPVEPGPMTISNGTYTPLSRPLFVYGATEHPANGSLSRAVVKDFLRFGFSARGTELVSGTGYVALTPNEIAFELGKIPA